MSCWWWLHVSHKTRAALKRPGVPAIRPTDPTPLSLPSAPGCTSGVDTRRHLTAVCVGRRRGRGFAGRMSWWDALFTGLRARRDDTWADMAMALLMRVINNVILATVMVMGSFTTGVVSLISSFDTPFLSGVLFWLAAVVAMLSVVLTACVGCCGCLVGVPLALASVAPAPQRRRVIDANGNLGRGGRHDE